MTAASQRVSLPVNKETKKNNGLLFQFILSEFIEAYEEIRKLGALSGRRELPLPLNIAMELVSGRSEGLIEESLLKLLGNSKLGVSCFSWNFADGLLTKLHAHSVLLLENGEELERELLAIHYYVEKSRVACHSALEAIKRKSENRAEFQSAVEKAILAMQRLSKLIARLPQKFREDENVLFFILRHTEQLDRLYGSRFVMKTLSRMYPKGLPEIRQLLSKKYANRGFDNVLPLIDSLIAELES